jgi:CSLREA domain-containing protein
MTRSHPSPLATSAPRPRTARRLSLLAWTLALAPLAAGAATISVTTATDVDLADADCSLREAIVAADGDVAYNGCPAGDGADRIVFSLSLPATIALSSDLPAIHSTLTIQGPGAGELTIDGGDLHRLLDFQPLVSGAWLGVEDLTLTRGLASSSGGGASVAIGAVAAFRRVHFLANKATNGGGGLEVISSSSAPTTVAVEECWFDGNLALGASGGGGLSVIGALAHVVVDRTTFSGNRAQSTTGGSSGGGLRLTDGVLTLTRSTLSGNVANLGGGGIFLSSATASPTLTIRDSTLTLNRADGDGDGVGDGGGLTAAISVAYPATLDLANTILAGNLDSGALTRPDVSLSSLAPFFLVSQGFNLVGSNEGGSPFFVAGLPNADGDWIGTAAAPIDPLLDALADRGGFAPTHRPTADLASPVIDQGSCTGSGSDQRGHGDAAAHVRIVDTQVPDGTASDGCDIGAYERGGDPQADPALFEDDFEAAHLLYWSTAAP